MTDLTRRHFLGLAALVPAAASLPLSVSGRAASTAAATRTLVLVELAGGNDGLNTVIPYSDPDYYRLRPHVAVAREQVLPLTPKLGLHPSLSPLLPYWKRKQLAVVNGVGYPEPNRSHFRSIEIWETASDSDSFGSEGWLAQAFPKHRLDSVAVSDGLVLGDQDLGPLHGPQSRSIVMAKPAAFFRQAKQMAADARSPAVKQRLANNPALAHLLRVQGDIVASASHLERTLAASPSAGGFPKFAFARQLETASRLIRGGANLPVIKVTLRGFDTHANQKPKHARLLEQLALSLAAFCDSLRDSPYWKATAIVTYSEFGRRVASNGSGGTDHGTAAPQLIMGGAVRGGMYGRQPSLTQLTGGDLLHTVDFRQVYATIARRHLNVRKLPQSLAKQPLLSFI